MRRRSPARPPAGRSAPAGAPDRSALAYKLTIRHGSSVGRESFDQLEDALSALERGVGRIRSEGGLPGISALREFDPGDRVAARLEISTGGWLRGADAGIDVMGDGRLVPYAGGIRRRELEPLPGEAPVEALRRELRG